jgi:hypothetical protein
MSISSMERSELDGKSPDDSKAERDNTALIIGS